MKVRGQCFSLVVDGRNYVVSIMPLPDGEKRMRPVPATLLDKMYRAMHESQPQKVTPKLAETIKQRYENGKTVNWLAERYGISRRSVKRIVNMLSTKSEKPQEAVKTEPEKAEAVPV